MINIKPLVIRTGFELLSPKMADLAAGADAWDVAQISERYGPGPFARAILPEMT